MALDAQKTRTEDTGEAYVDVQKRAGVTVRSVLLGLGLAISGSYLARRTAFTIFVAWLIKLVMLKVGGPGFYRKSRPLFVGLLVGYVLGVAFSAGIDMIWFPERGHYVHRY